MSSRAAGSQEILKWSSRTAVSFAAVSPYEREGKHQERSLSFDISSLSTRALVPPVKTNESISPSRVSSSGTQLVEVVPLEFLLTSQIRDADSVALLFQRVVLAGWHIVLWNASGIRYPLSIAFRCFEPTKALHTQDTLIVPFRVVSTSNDGRAISAPSALTPTMCAEFLGSSHSRPSRQDRAGSKQCNTTQHSGTEDLIDSLFV